MPARAASPAGGAPALPTVDAPCFLCGAAEAAPLWVTPDRAFAVPGMYAVARCRRCGFLYQRPRVRDDHLADCYPDHYPRHQEPSPRIPFKGSSARVRAVRWAVRSLRTSFSVLSPTNTSTIRMQRLAVRACRFLPD